MDELNFNEDRAEKTDNIERCENWGCGFNVSGECGASGTECFGYICPYVKGEK